MRDSVTCDWGGRSHTDVPELQQGHAFHSVRREQRDLIVLAWIGTNSDHLFLIY